tara:strand:+ start:337 stop:570 length:234 start_codon:yes stop_codon:yes gene_type:complete
MTVGYVLISVSPGEENNAFQAIKEIENVVDATMLFGDYDIIVKLKAEDLGLIAKIVVNIIRQVPGVTGTKTLAGAEI